MEGRPLSQRSPCGFVVDKISFKEFFFDVLLTARISIFISVINQLDAQNFCFKISLFHAYRCDDTRGCVMQFRPPDDEHMCSKHVEASNKTYCKTKIVCIKLVNY